MTQVTMTVRTDADLKATFTKLCEEFGMSANTAMNVFMRAVAETKSIPFPIGKRRISDTDNLIRLMEENRKYNQSREDMTLDELYEISGSYGSDMAERGSDVGEECGGKSL